MKVAFISPFDVGGGAENIAWNLFQGLKQERIQTWFLVREKRSDSSDVIILDSDRYRTRWARFWVQIGDVLKPFEGKVRGAIRLRKAIHLIGQPERRRAIQKGYEDFDFPATYHMFEFLPDTPDIVHCHNLHGYYFDLRALPWLSHKVPTVLTLHDVWLLTGHCSVPFGCERWKIGCGNCPDLNLPPAIKKDATDKNWLRKHEIYKNALLYVVTPSQWLMNMVNQSILSSGIALKTIIPNGIDTDVYSPGDKLLARKELNLPPDAFIMLFVSTDIKRVEKGFALLREALHMLAERNFSHQVLCVALGGKVKTKTVGSITFQYVPFQKDKERVVQYYRASDVYVHPALQDNYPNTVLEALSCGLPVVASSAGGIPEQVLHEYTGFLVPPRDSQALAHTLENLIQQKERLHHMGKNARRYILEHHTLKQQVHRYIEFYTEALQDWNHRKRTAHK